VFSGIHVTEEFIPGGSLNLLEKWYIALGFSCRLVAVGIRDVEAKVLATLALLKVLFFGRVEANEIPFYLFD
jgi:hypothetical protein